MSFSTPRPGCPPCDSTLAPFLHADGLPFADVLTAADIAQAFADEQVSFGQTAQAFWTPALTLWAFLSQVLSGIKSCRPAVARAFVALALTRAPADLDTGNYCRARAKLPLAVLQRLTLQVGHVLEEAAPAAWLWHGRHAFLVDGFTVTLPDTPENQKAYPQPGTQNPGLGFPLLRAVVVLSLATAAVGGLAVGPYQGKESGETALLRTLLDRLAPGTIVVADRFFCSYFMVALLRARGVAVVLRLHQGRSCDFRRGRRLGPDDHVVTWHKPQRPAWMDKETYAAMPATLEVREVRKRVAVPGNRVQELVVVTTLLDAGEYSSEDITDLYHKRWQAELDLRSLKTTMQMDILLGKTPEMVRKEVWAHLLAYNLLRTLMAKAARATDVPPETLSVAGARQTVNAFAPQLMAAATPEQHARLCAAMYEGIATHHVGDRPDRFEPRAVKRRPKNYPRLKEPRREARSRLAKGGSGLCPCHSYCHFCRCPTPAVARDRGGTFVFITRWGSVIEGGAAGSEARTGMPPGRGGRHLRRGARAEGTDSPRGRGARLRSGAMGRAIALAGSALKPRWSGGSLFNDPVAGLSPPARRRPTPGLAGVSARN